MNEEKWRKSLVKNCWALYVIIARTRYDRMAYKFKIPSYFSQAALLSGAFMGLITFGRNERGELSGRVTWKNFLEALGKCFGWILVRVSERSEFSHVHPNKRA